MFLLKFYGIKDNYLAISYLNNVLLSQKQTNSTKKFPQFFYQLNAIFIKFLPNEHVNNPKKRVRKKNPFLKA